MSNHLVFRAPAVLALLLALAPVPVPLQAEEGAKSEEMTRIEAMLESAHAEIREFRQAGGKDDDPEHPGRSWSSELWKVRQEHPGTEAADRATVEAIHFLIHAGQASKAVELALEVPPRDRAWSELDRILFEACEESGDFAPFIRRAAELERIEFDVEKRSRLLFQVAQANWVAGDLPAARRALRDLRRINRSKVWELRILAARDELGHPEIRDAEPSRRTARDLWQRPGRVLESLGVRRGDRVADVGSGGGYFTWLLAWRVGPEGRVYAVDIDEESLERLESGAAERGLDHIETLLGDDDDPRLPPAELDAILVVDTYHEFRDWKGMLTGLHEALAPGGRLVIVDIPGEAGLERTEYHAQHQIPAELVMEEARMAGFRVTSSKPTFINQPGGRKFFLVVFEKS